MTAGAVAAVLALVVAAIALPMVLRRTRAASTTTVTAPATDTTPPSADVTAPATTVPTTPAPGTEALPASTSGIAAPATGRQDRAAQLPVSTPRDNSGRAPGGQAPAKVSGVNDRTAGAGNSGDGSAAPAPATTPASSAELEQAQERMTQVGARASAAKRSVGIMRSQQQADGLGMRGDVESAESRMDSYLSSANSALARGDGAAAQRALDKADVEVTKLEKFLGH